MDEDFNVVIVTGRQEPRGVQERGKREKFWIKRTLDQPEEEGFIEFEKKTGGVTELWSALSVPQAGEPTLECVAMASIE